VQGHDRSGYFVRLGATPASPASQAMHTRYEPVDEDLPPPKKGRKFRFRLRPLTVVGLLLVGWLVWAATTPGGVSARIDGISDSIQGLLDDATTDPGLKRAAKYYNDQYERTGAYSQLTQSEIDNDPDAGWGVGVTVEYCNRDAVVLHSLTGRGTISRLLVQGQDLGDVPQKQACPADLTNPLPWKYPSAD
jgi:hypothetical protein